MGKAVPANNHYFALRHGESEKNVPELLVVSYPELKPYHLTSKGREQVRKAAKWLAKKGIDLIFVSDLTRTRESAEIVSEITDAPVVIDKRLRDLSFGELNGKTTEEYHAFFNDHKDLRERFARAPNGGETLQQVLDRMMDFLHEIEAKYKGKNILIISHGDPLWLLEWGSQCLPKEELHEIHYHKVGEPGEMKITCPIK